MDVANLKKSSLFFAVVIFKLYTLATTLQQDFSSFTECQSTYTQRNGTITSPIISSSNFTGALTCNWRIDTRNESTSHHLQLKVLEIDLEGNMPLCMSGNYIELFLGCEYTSIGRFCGVSVLPVFYSTDGCMGISLHSRGGKSNIKAVYSLRPLDKEVQHIPSGCGVSQMDNIRHGNIFSPNWPLPYPDYVDCVWTVRPRKDLEVKLIFFDFDLKFHKPCKLIDYIEVRAGSNGYVHARKLTNDEECGKKKPFSMIISTETFYITFRSDKGTGPRGFMAGFVAYKKGTPSFDPQVLIIFGCSLFIILIVVLRKTVCPALFRARKRFTENGAQRFKFWFSRPPCRCGYDCSCQWRASVRHQMSLRRIEACADQEPTPPPIIPKECFIEKSEVSYQPSCESTFVSLHGAAGSFTTKSASDLGCAPFNETFLSPLTNLQSDPTDERRSTSKLVRFANPKLLNHPSPSSSS